MHLKCLYTYMFLSYCCAAFLSTSKNIIEGNKKGKIASYIFFLNGGICSGLVNASFSVYYL